MYPWSIFLLIFYVKFSISLQHSGPSVFVLDPHQNLTHIIYNRLNRRGLGALLQGVKIAGKSAGKSGGLKNIVRKTPTMGSKSKSRVGLSQKLKALGKKQATNRNIGETAKQRKLEGNIDSSE
ncbi:unnamed protein product, partial [Didymodactylos carnosus]